MIKYLRVENSPFKFHKKILYIFFNIYIPCIVLIFFNCGVFEKKKNLGEKCKIRRRRRNVEIPNILIMFTCMKHTA